MEDMPTRSPETNKDVAQRPGRLKMMLGIVVALITIVAATAAVYFWQGQKVDELTKNNTALNEQLVAAQNNTPAIDDDNEKMAVYEANIGKFKLTLPDKYVVIVRNDGGGEGGDYTALLIGDKTSKQGVVVSSAWSSVTLSAHSLHGETFRSLVDADLKDKGPFDQSTVQVDGVSAESYKVGGLADPKIIYFSKGDLFYQISLDSMDASANKLDAIIAGFKFN